MFVSPQTVRTMFSMTRSGPNSVHYEDGVTILCYRTFIIIKLTEVKSLSFCSFSWKSTKTIFLISTLRTSEEHIANTFGQLETTKQRAWTAFAMTSKELKSNTAGKYSPLRNIIEICQFARMTVPDYEKITLSDIF